MRSIKLALLYGFLLWLIPFIVAIVIFPIRESNYPFFETIMPVTLTICSVAFGVQYLKKTENDIVREGIKIGILWFFMSLIIDLPMFMWGPMARSFGAYMTDIGLTYLIYPIVTVGLARVKKADT